MSLIEAMRKRVMPAMTLEIPFPFKEKDGELIPLAENEEAVLFFTVSQIPPKQLELARFEANVKCEQNNVSPYVERKVNGETVLHRSRTFLAGLIESQYRFFCLAVQSAKLGDVELDEKDRQQILNNLNDDERTTLLSKYHEVVNKELENAQGGVLGKDLPKL